MPLDTATFTTTDATMEEAEPSRDDIRTIDSVQGQDLDNDSDHMEDEQAPEVDSEFEESQCLFCNQTNGNLDQNLAHMSKAHGLHIDQTHLIVDVASLLAYFHLIISGYHECICCGKQRNTRGAIQQHMMAKGHCKYDISDECSEFREFYEFPQLNLTERLSQRLSASLDRPRRPLQDRSRKPRSTKPLDKQSTDLPYQDPLTPTAQSHPDSHKSSSETADEFSNSVIQPRTRAQKQEYTHSNQLARLRAEDRRSLMHLPVSQQRAILATHHNQMEKARRTEQTQRGNLEAAGNHFNRLSTMRLIRKPPHTGNMFSLNR